MSVKLIRLAALDYDYLSEVVRAAAAKKCDKKNCGTVCLCQACAARRVLPSVESAERVSA